MATITRFKTTDDYDPLHTLLNRPIEEIEAILTNLENRDITADEAYILSRIVRTAPITIDFAGFNSAAVDAVRRGDTVSIALSVSAKTANYMSGATWRDVGTLPSRFRPAAVGGSRFLTARRHGASGETADVEILPSGLIRIRNYSAATHVANATVQFSDTFVTDSDYVS